MRWFSYVCQWLRQLVQKATLLHVHECKSFFFSYITLLVASVIIVCTHAVQWTDICWRLALVFISTPYPRPLHHCCCFYVHINSIQSTVFTYTDVCRSMAQVRYIRYSNITVTPTLAPAVVIGSSSRSDEQISVDGLLDRLRTNSTHVRYITAAFL